MQAIGLTRPGLSRIGAPAGLSLVPGAVAYWDCTQVVGQTVPDLSGNGNHATLGSTIGVDTNDPTPTDTGIVLGGDDFALCPATINYGNQDSTLTAVFTPSAVANMAVIGKPAVGNNGWGILLAGGDNRAVFEIGDPYLQLYSTQTFSPGTPVMITGVISGNQAMLYVNGIRITSGTILGPTDLSTTPFCVGKRNGSGLYGAQGIAHAGRVHPRTLSPAEIAQEYAYFKAKFARLGVVLP